MAGKFNLVLIINVILALAIIIIYVMYFVGKKDNDDRKNESIQNPMNFPDSKSGVSVAFVNTDILLERYELVKKMSDEFEKEQKKRDADLQKRTSEYQQEAAYFQESVQNQRLSDESAQGIYEQLMVKQQELYDLQQQYSNELAQREFEMNKVLLDTVKNYLHRMNIDRNYDYILNYTMAGPILLAKDTFDITNPVLRALNQEYKDQYAPGK